MAAFSAVVTGASEPSARVGFRGEGAAEVHLRHGGSRLRARQGHHLRLPRPALQSSRGVKVAVQKLDPYVNVDPGTMNPVRARRGVRARRRRRDRPRPRPLRAIHRHRPASRCRTSPPARSTRAVIAKERRGDYLGKTVQVIPHITDEIKERVRSARRDRGRRPRDRRDRRHRGRHRVAAVPRGDPAAPQRDRPRPMRVRARVADAVHRSERRAQDQTHAALGEGAAVARYPARRDRVPFRPADRAQPQGEDLAALRRADQRRDQRSRRSVDLRGAAGVAS